MDENLQEIVRIITQKSFQQEPKQIEQILEKGIVNLVFKVTLDTATYILRMQKGESALKAYQKEKWCMERVSEIGVPSPRCVALGIENGYSFSFQTYIEGVCGKELPDEINRIWFTLGQYAKKFHSITASDYAVNLQWLNSYLFDEGFFEEKHLFTTDKLLQIKSRINEMKAWNDTPMLNHGNLNPSNTVVDPSGLIHLIDWGTAGGGRAPHGDLAELYTWNTGKENIQTFLKGCGMDEAKVLEMMHDIQTLILVRLLTTLRWKIKRTENWSNNEFIVSTTSALNEIEDYTADIIFHKNL
jgi:aminoglycoside phosphotransferase (APT) family kinase protein